MTNAVAIDAGSSHTCAVLDDGTARCWGKNNFGQLGDGTQTSSTLPKVVFGLTEASDIAAGGGFSCAQRTDGTARCWGVNASGQLGNGANTISSVPVVVTDVVGVTAIDTGVDHACATSSEGSTFCWGNNGDGELGDGTTTSSNTPVKVTGLVGAVAIAGGGNDHSCAIIDSGDVWCWGSNFYGQLGTGTNTDSLVPVQVTAIGPAATITAGNIHTCATLADGTARCWGWGAFGQLGHGSTPNQSSAPVTVTGLSGTTAITAGLAYSCDVRTDGTARCWGRNSHGELGDGTTTDSSVPVAVIDP